MCFSASASVIAGLTTAGLGIASIKKTRGAAEIPLATIPLLFGVQQLIEGVVWLSLQEPRAAAWNGVATFAYSVFSHVLWPSFVPLAVLLVEPDGARRRALIPLLSLGALVSAYLLFFVVFYPVTSEVVNHSIAYTYHHHFPGVTMLLYLSAVCVSAVISSFAILRFFGIGLAVTFVASYLLYAETYFSVWCFLAAVMSVVLYLHFRARKKAT